MQARLTGALRQDYGGQFFSNYGLAPYVDNTAPCLFIGCYRTTENGIELPWSRWRDILAVCSHRGPALQMWCGSDSEALWDTSLADEFRRRPNIRHVSTSLAIGKALDLAGLPHKFLPIHWVDADRFRPCPLGDAVFFYDYEHPIKSASYGSRVADAIQSKMPHIEFIRLKAGDVARDDMAKVYEKCFLGLRLKEHDGMAATLLELGLMGRRTIHNGFQPSAIRWDGIGDVMASIQREWLFHKATKNAELDALADATRRHMTMPDGWQTEEFWEDQR